MVRVSGPRAAAVAASVFRAADERSLDRICSPTVVVGYLQGDFGYEAALGTRIPCDLFLWPTARSYTREPVAELHTIGSPPLLRAALSAVCRAARGWLNQVSLRCEHFLRTGWI